MAVQPGCGPKGQEHQEAEIQRVQAEALSLVDAVFSTLTDRLASDPKAPHDLDPNRVVFLHEVSAQAVHGWVQDKYIVPRQNLESSSR